MLADFSKGRPARPMMENYIDLRRNGHVVRDSVVHDREGSEWSVRHQLGPVQGATSTYWMPVPASRWE